MINIISPDITGLLTNAGSGVLNITRKIDYRIFWAINKKYHNRILDYIMDVWTNYIWFIFLLLLVVGVLLYVDRKKFLVNIRFLIYSVLLGALVVFCLKEGIGRLRPLSIFGTKVSIFTEKLYLYSFPSGHTQFAFSVATYLSYKLKMFWWAFFIVAVFTGISRIYVGSHFPIDVLTGAIIGISSSLLIMKWQKSKKMPDQ